MRVLAAVFLLSFTVEAVSADQPYLEFGPMLGHVGPAEAHIWAKASAKAELGVRVWGPGDEKGRTIKGVKLDAGTEFMGRVAITELAPATKYSYTLLLNGKPAQLRPYPSFTTAPETGAKTKLRFAFGSCIGKTAVEPAALWADMAARVQLDMLFLLGDNHYADSTDPAKQRPAYYVQRGVGGFKEVSARTATYAIWDDHDFGPNDSDGTAAGKEISLRTFKEFWANPSYGEADNPGVYYKFSRGNVDFFMLDGRYHRTPNKTPEDGKKTMLGEKQLAWIKKELQGSTAPVKFVAMGSEWQSYSQPDSWTSFKRERQEFFDFIEQQKITGVIFLSGDRHFTGGYQILGRFIEITAGPLGAKNYPTKNLPEMFYNEGAGKLYSVFDVDTTADVPAVTLEVYRAGEGQIYKRAFSWDEINGKTKIPPLPAPEAK